MHWYIWLTLCTDLVQMVQIVDNCLWYVMEIEKKEQDEER
jgi:hypothetical protein